MGAVGGRAWVSQRAGSSLQVGREGRAMPRTRPLLLCAWLGLARTAGGHVVRGDNFAVPAAPGGCSGTAEFLGCFKVSSCALRCVQHWIGSTPGL